MREGGSGTQTFAYQKSPDKRGGGAPPCGKKRSTGLGPGGGGAPPAATVYGHSNTSLGGGGWHKASVSGCLPLAAPIGLWPLLILTLRGSERVLVVSTEPPDDLSCLTTPGVGCPGDRLFLVPLTRGIQMQTRSPCGVRSIPAPGGGGGADRAGTGLATMKSGQRPSSWR